MEEVRNGLHRTQMPLVTRRPGCTAMVVFEEVHFVHRSLNWVDLGGMVLSKSAEQKRFARRRLPNGHPVRFVCIACRSQRFPLLFGAEEKVPRQIRIRDCFFRRHFKRPKEFLRTPLFAKLAACNYFLFGHVICPVSGICSRIVPPVKRTLCHALRRAILRDIDTVRDIMKHKPHPVRFLDLPGILENRPEKIGAMAAASRRGMSERRTRKENDIALTWADNRDLENMSAEQQQFYLLRVEKLKELVGSVFKSGDVPNVYDVSDLFGKLRIKTSPTGTCPTSSYRVVAGFPISISETRKHWSSTWRRTCTSKARTLR